MDKAAGSNLLMVLTWVVLIPAFFYTLYLMRRDGIPQGIYLPWFIAMFLVPAWLMSGIGSLRLDTRSAVGIAILIGFLLQPWQAGPRIRWFWTDLWMCGIIASQAASEFMTENLVPMTPLEQMREWGLPYLVGRLALREPNDLYRMLPSLCVVTAILCGYAIVEAFLKFNIVNDLLGKRWANLDSSEGFRWGLKRAQGNLGHPIYLGLLLVMALPWIMEAYHRAKRGEGPAWWGWMPALTIVAMVGTVSRAAQIATVAALGADFIFRNVRWRGLLLAGALAATAVGFLFRDDILDSLSKYAGEAQMETVRINGKEYEYTGTLHRDLLAIVYEDAVEKVRPLGYGSMFEGMPRDPDMDARFVSIDDHYLMYYLRYGPVGMAIFFAFAGFAAFYILREAWAADSPHAGFCGCLFGAFVSTTLMVKGVAMEADFGWMWLFAAGAAARLRGFRLERDERAPAARA